MSITVSVSVPATVRRRASMSSTAPLADCTRLTVTTSKSAAAETNSPGANSVTFTPLPACAANGKVVLVNSPASVATLLPSGTAAATSPSTADTLPPITTESTGTPASAAYPARPARTCSSNKGTFIDPDCHWAMQSCSASTMNCGG